MTHVAHQRYAELVDEEVYLETLQFNAKAHYAILPPFRGSVYLTSVSNERLSELIYADVSVAGAGERIEVARADGEPTLPYRVESATSFEPNASADFDALKRIVSSALMAQPSEIGLGRMPYPSGGALYSVLTFACRTSAVVNGWPEGDTVFQVQPFCSNAGFGQYQNAARNPLRCALWRCDGAARQARICFCVRSTSRSRTLQVPLSRIPCGGDGSRCDVPKGDGRNPGAQTENQGVGGIQRLPGGVGARAGCHARPADGRSVRWRLAGHASLLR